MVINLFYLSMSLFIVFEIETMTSKIIEHTNDKISNKTIIVNTVDEHSSMERKIAVI